MWFVAHHKVCKFGEFLQNLEGIRKRSLDSTIHRGPCKVYVVFDLSQVEMPNVGEPDDVLKMLTSTTGHDRKGYFDDALQWEAVYISRQQGEKKDVTTNHSIVLSEVIRNRPDLYWWTYFHRHTGKGSNGAHAHRAADAAQPRTPRETVVAIMERLQLHKELQIERIVSPPTQPTPK